MVKTTIKILKFEDGNAGNCRFQTENWGWMSAFDNGDNLIQDLKDHTNRLISVDTSQSKKLKQDGTPYVNIRKFYGAADPSELPATADEFAGAKVQPKDNQFFKKAPEVVTRKSVKGTAYEKDPVGLCIELMCTGISAGDAIEAVQRCQSAFN
jgi:hypothetical protein